MSEEEEIPTPKPTPADVLKAVAEVPAKVAASAIESVEGVKSKIRAAKETAAEAKALKAAEKAEAKAVKEMQEEQKDFKEKFDWQGFVDSTNARLAALEEDYGHQDHAVGALVDVAKAHRWIHHQFQYKPAPVVEEPPPEEEAPPEAEE